MTDSNSKADFFNDESQVTVFKPINTHEYTINKFKAHKEWSASSNNYNNSYNNSYQNKHLEYLDQWVVEWLYRFLQYPH